LFILRCLPSRSAIKIAVHEMATNTQESSDDRIRSLEGKYIALLEERIKELEAVVDSRKGVTAKSKAVRSNQCFTVARPADRFPKHASTTKNKAPTASDNVEIRDPRAEAAGESQNRSLDDPANPYSKDTSTTEDNTVSDMVTPADQPYKSIPIGPQHLIRVRDRITSKSGAVKESDGDLSGLQFSKQKKLNPTEKSSLAALNDQAPTPQVTWLRHVSEKGRYTSSEFTIHARELRVLLRTVLADCPGLHLAPHSPIKFESPFVPLIHNWNRLTALAAEDLAADKESPEIAEFRSRIVKSADFDQAREQLKLLLDSLRLTPELNVYLASLEAQNNERTIQFDQLWTIFPPGEVVYSTVFMDEPQLFVVKESGPRPSQGKNKNIKNLRREMDELLDGFKGRLLDALTNEPNASRPQSRWSMVAWTYDWNGTSFERVPVRFTFDSFTGNRAISTLHCHPLRFHEGEHTGAGGGTDSSVAALKEMLVDRGRRFKEVCVKEKGSQMFDYDGDAISHGTGFQNPSSLDLKNWSRDQGKTRHIRGRVMVDFRAYLQNVPSPGRFGPLGIAEISKDDVCSCSTCSANHALSNTQKTHYDGATADSMFDDLQYMICPPRVLGYHLESRTWLELNLGNRKGGLDHSTKRESCLTDIAQLKSNVAFERLQLYETQKVLIRDLVRNHSDGTNSKPWVEDIVKNKGKGLVILLHGPPGVGKTLTAGKFVICCSLRPKLTRPALCHRKRRPASG